MAENIASKQSLQLQGVERGDRRNKLGEKIMKGFVKSASIQTENRAKDAAK